MSMPKFNQFFPQKGHAGRLSAAIERLRHRVHDPVPSTRHPDPSSERSSSPSEGLDSWQMAAIHEVVGHAVTLGPLVKRREYSSFTGLPEGLRLGWAQMPETDGRGFSLGVFSGDNQFSQLALADDRGRVFIAVDPTMDTHDLVACLIFGKEGNVRIPRSPRMHAEGLSTMRQGVVGLAKGLAAEAFGGTDDELVDAIQGGIIGRDDAGQMLWLASWLKRENRYTLEQLRASLPESMRINLEYRDAVAIGFFAAYLLPRMHQSLIGFGSGNIFRRLNREAPIGAIRRSVRDTVRARSQGLRTSGLEEYFSDLMNEAGALDTIPGLEAAHGAEPLHLYTSSYSGSYFLTWDSSLEFSPALSALRIEGNLNRFADVSVVLERNTRLGAQPIEDTATRAQVAQIDLALLNNPALIALKSEDPQPVDVLHDDGITAVLHMVDAARRAADSIAREHPDPTVEGPGQTGSQWVYRQTMSTLLCSLRLPYRFDVEFRSNLVRRNAAIAFTTAGVSMMPASRYDADSRSWTAIDDAERARMSARYNLRVGLMMAAISFGASPDVNEVSLHIDSVGLEEAVAQQDSAIAKLMGQAFTAFDRLRNPDASIGSSKADPKDGDIHGDPSHTSTPLDDADHIRHDDMPTQDQGARRYSAGSPTHDGEDSTGTAASAPDFSAASAASPATADAAGPDAGNGSDDTAHTSEPGTSEPGTSDGDRSVNRQFEDLMKGVEFQDIDEMTFSTPQDAENMNAENMNAQNPDAQDQDGGDGISGNTEDQDDGADDDEDPDDPMSALSGNPTVRNMVTVTFTRERFMQRLHDDGLRHPDQTYRLFDAAMDLDDEGALKPVNAEFNLRDARFSPVGAQEEPEFSDTRFEQSAARILGARQASDLSIQRVDVLQRAVSDFHTMAAAKDMPSVEKAQRAMRIISDIGDPELNTLALRVGSALIDEGDTPEFDFPLSHELDASRLKARNLLFSGQVDQAIQLIETDIERIDRLFAGTPGVPRYFNSYAERVIYNRMFATSGEHTVLIPDNLFYAHMELADVLAQIKGAKASLPHLNAMVSYAPAYPLSHMKLAIQLARNEDWDSAYAACLNALRVSLDRNDAAFAYYRFAYAAWMRDEFDVAVAAYMMSDHIAPNQIAALDGELHELVARAQSQCVPIPDTVEQAQQVLRNHNLPVWPHTEAAQIVRDAARVCVDHGMFVPARTLSMAAARMNDSDSEGIDIVHAQFLRSLNT